jgi:Skp family chaperone for outer membrane proteins
MKKFAIGAAVALSLAIPAAASAQRAPTATIVVVDRNRILTECTACRAAQPQLQNIENQFRQRAQALGQPIETELQSIQQAAAAARNQQGPARTTAETAIQQRLQALEARRTTAQQELGQLEQNYRSTLANVLQQIEQRMNPIITQVMTQRGANLAIDVAATYAHAPAINVTDAVLAALNQQLPSVVVAPLPQQPQQPRPQPSGR